jgi:DNA-binding transcriptional LysR family regulator
MELRHLRTFVTVAELGTVSKAALGLRVAQSALSRQIGELQRVPVIVAHSLNA